ncbi:MAG: cytochrome c [Candidatus Thiodiazotropha endolucinida]
MKRRRIVLLFSMSLLASAPVLATDGAKLYVQSCLACHGSDGVGVMPGVRDLTDPGGPLSKADDALFRSIRDGVQSMEGAMAMPARGGNPALRDSDIYLLIDYLRRNFGSDEHAALTPPGEKP